MIKKSRRSADIPMASMSDIAFLLIIFFITSISFMYRQGLKLTLPKKDSAPVVIPAGDILMLNLNKNGDILQGAKRITPETITVGRESAAIIRVDSECPYRSLVAAIEALQNKDITRISIKKL